MTDRQDTRSTPEDTATPHGLSRRGLLRAGAGAAAGIATLAATRAGAQEKVLDDSYRDEFQAFDEPVTGEQCPPHGPAPLPDLDEGCEAVLALLFVDLARGAFAGGARDIRFDAIIWARGAMRKRVYDMVRDHGLWQALALEYPKESPKWHRIGQAVGPKGMEIQQADLQAAFVAEYGNAGGPPQPLYAPEDEGTEVIGGHLWVRFTVGVMGNGASSFDYEAIHAGRVHSRVYVRRNVTRNALVPQAGGWAVDYAKWAKNTVGECAHRAGVKAGKLAGGKRIDEATFHEAWCHAQDLMARFVRSQGIVTITSAACS